MKIRTGFVSNSSSASFVCDLCKRYSGGWDSDQYSDHKMILCENGHALCIDHIGTDYPTIEGGRLLASYCPICTLAKKMGVSLTKRSEQDVNYGED